MRCALLHYEEQAAGIFVAGDLRGWREIAFDMRHPLIGGKKRRTYSKDISGRARALAGPFKSTRAKMVNLERKAATKFA